MKKEIVTTGLLSLAIGFVAIGIHINNPFIILLGGFFCGIYNGLINQKN